MHEISNTWILLLHQRNNTDDSMKNMELTNGVVISVALSASNVFTFHFASNIVDAIEALHLSGYYCPYLHGDNIAVIRQYGSVNAKLWEFRPCSSGKYFFP